MNVLDGADHAVAGLHIAERDGVGQLVLVAGGKERGESGGRRRPEEGRVARGSAAACVAHGGSGEARADAQI